MAMNIIYLILYISEMVGDYMYSIDKKIVKQDRDSFLYHLENLETLEVVKVLSRESFNEGDIVNLEDNKIILLEDETTKRKEKLQNRLNKLFSK